MSIEKIVISQKLELFTDYFNPKIVGELNGQHLKLVKFKGEFVWHKHDHEDEMFLVISGSFNMELRDKIINLAAGEFVVIPKGVEHKPMATEEVHVMLFEPATTINTGNAASEFTRQQLQRI